MKKGFLILSCYVIVLMIGIIPPNVEGGGDTENITTVYQQLTKQFSAHLNEGNYLKAFHCAKEQLEIDPSDTVAYMRLAVSAQHVKVDKEILKKQYAPYVSEEDALHKDIKALANFLLSLKP